MLLWLLGTLVMKLETLFWQQVKLDTMFWLPMKLDTLFWLLKKLDTLFWLLMTVVVKLGSGHLLMNVQKPISGQPDILTQLSKFNCQHILYIRKKKNIYLKLANIIIFFLGNFVTQKKFDNNSFFNVF